MTRPMATLVSAVAGGGTPATPPVVSDYYAACVALTQSTSETFTVDTSAVLTAADGDLIVMEYSVGSVSGPPQVYGLPADAIYISTGTGNGNFNCDRRTGWACWFYNSASPTVTIGSKVLGSGIPFCYRLYVVQNPCRRKPVDFINRFAGDEDTCLISPPTRSHSEPARVMGSFVLTVDTVDTPTGIPTAASSMLWGDYAEFFYGNQSGMSPTAIIKFSTAGRPSKSDWQSLFSNAPNTGSGSLSGWTQNNLQLDPTPAADLGDFNRDHFVTFGATGVVRHCLSQSFSATEGDEICFMAMIKAREPSSGTKYYLFPSLVVPGGQEYLNPFSTSYVSSWDGEVAGNPDWNIGLWPANVAITSDRGFLTGFIHTAPVTGTYTVRLNALRSTNSLDYETSTNPTAEAQLYSHLAGAGLSLNGTMPPYSLAWTGSTEEGAVDNHIPMPILKTDYNSHSGESWNTTGHYSDFFQLPEPDDTLLPVRVISVGGNLPVPPQFNDANQLQVVSSGGTYIAGIMDFVYRADQCVLPYYRTSEAGSDLDGKYYWEVTVKEASTYNRGWVGFVVPAAAHGGAETNFWSLPPVYSCVYRFDGAISGYTGAAATGYSTVAADDIISFAVDIPGRTASIYRNGSLVATVDFVDPAGSADTDLNEWAEKSPIYACGRGYASASTGDGTGLYFNFGAQAFAYTPPTGYVAYDFANAA